jgi:transcription elongation factor GreB
MSKAFTRESDESAFEELPSVRTHLPPGTRNYVTSEGAEHLKQRLNGLLERKRAWAAGGSAPGTVPETDQRKLESAIRKLQQVLDSVVVADIPADREKIAFGATVTLRQGNGGEDTYRLVGVEEADPDKGAISWMSPLARALLSRRAGDKVRFQSPQGVEELTVLMVRF